MATKKQEIVKASSSELADIPEDFRTHAGFGSEKITSEDVRPPRLKLAQSTSPQTKKMDPAYIEGLGEGDAFNDLTGEIYQFPIKFAVISYLGTRYVEFGEGGKVVDGSVAPNDPRTKWGENEDGDRVKPVASKLYDYLVFLVDSQEVVAFSLKDKQAETIGKTINSLITLPTKIGGKLCTNPPACARLFLLGNGTDKNEMNSWAVWTLKNAGFTDEDTRQACYAIGKSFGNKKIVIEDREPGSDDGEEVPDLTK